MKKKTVIVMVLLAALALVPVVAQQKAAPRPLMGFLHKPTDEFLATYATEPTGQVYLIFTIAEMDVQLRQQRAQIAALAQQVAELKKSPPVDAVTAPIDGEPKP